MVNICTKCKGHINGCPYEDEDMTMCDEFKENVEYEMIAEVDENTLTFN